MSKNKGTLVSSTIRPLSTNSPMATAVANELLGGYHTVNGITDRDAITYDRRTFGMLVYVLNTDEFYQLKTTNSADLSDNLNWNPVTFSGSGSNTEWLDSVISRSGTPPISPSLGERYLVVGGSGIWTTFNDLVVEWNGLSYDLTIPTEGTTVRVDDETTCLYVYLNGDYPSGTWTKQDFVVDPFEPLWNIEPSKTINVGTNSEYLIYGDLNVDGTLNTWGKVVVMNGSITGSGSVNILSGGTVQQVDMLTEIYGGTGISIDSTSLSTRTVSVDIVAGSGITLSNSGNSLVVSSLGSATANGASKYVIQSTETITVPDYEEYWIYGDLTVYGTLDIGTYGKVVVANGDFIAASGSLVNNMGNVEVYDLLTVADDNLKVDITEIKYGKAGRILFESELKYIPLIGTYARVLTESDNLVYSTSSAYLTSTHSSTLDNYLGISTNDPLKKVHIRNSGILIDGSEAEQDKSLGDPNWARIVVDTGTSNVQDILDFRNDQGRVLFVSGAIEGGNRYPSVSIGTSSTDKLFQITDYYSTHTFLELTRTGSFSQINTNGFKLINNDFDGVFATVSGSGAYYDDGVTVKFAGVADNSNAGGTFGAGVTSIDRSNGYFNQIAVQSDYAYISVEDTVNGIVSDVFAYTHSLSLGYASAPSATIEEITLSDYGIKNTITGTFSIQNVFSNDLLSVSDTGTVSIYGLTNSMDTNVVTWNSTTKELGYRTDLIELKSFDVTIPSADVLDIFNTPYELVPAQGANKIIVPTSIQAQMIFNTTPYATDGEIDIYCGGSRSVWGFPADDGFLFGTVTRIVNGGIAFSSNTTATQYVANQPLTIKTVGSNPTSGDSDIRIFGTYRVIDIS